MDAQMVLLVGLGLLAASLLLVVLEIFIPSAGLLAIGAGVAAIAGIVILFRHPDSPLLWGFIGIGLVMVGAPASLAFGLKVWPHTPIGKKMLMGEATEEELEAKRLAEHEAREKRRALVGAEGQVVTPLRPVGIVKIGDQRFDALAETGLIETGQRVKVTAVYDNQIKVRAL